MLNTHKERGKRTNVVVTRETQKDLQERSRHPSLQAQLWRVRGVLAGRAEGCAGRGVGGRGLCPHPPPGGPVGAQLKFGKAAAHAWYPQTWRPALARRSRGGQRAPSGEMLPREECSPWKMLPRGSAPSGEMLPWEECSLGRNAPSGGVLPGGVLPLERCSLGRSAPWGGVLPLERCSLVGAPSEGCSLGGSAPSGGALPLEDAPSGRVLPLERCSLRKSALSEKGKWEDRGQGSK